MSDPVVRHRLVVEALDRQIERVCEIDTFVDSGSNNLDDVLTIGTTLDYLGGVKTLVAGLEGRRRILQRHHPVLCSHCPESRQHYVCAEHYAVNWDECPDRLDAASGLETTDG
jgi:hypothetical protein